MPTPSVFVIEGVIRHYAWGSMTAIPDLRGTKPGPEPAAELWLGAHPGDPARVPSLDTTLDALIAAEPTALLGEQTVAKFGPRLPFLLKLLAADKALSIQVHPTIAQAEAGFAAEERAGVPRDAPSRSYRDLNHKPELLCALTRFEALCGFRPAADTVALLDELPADVGAALAQVRADLTNSDGSAGLRAAFTRLLTLDTAQRRELVERVVSGCRTLVTKYAPLASSADGAVGVARMVDLCARDFPGDIGAVLSLLLNPVVLQPGEAIYLGAGNVHAYLRGLGVEIMANSDNVLRCGLTPKQVDVPGLLKITDFTPLVDPRWPDGEPVPVADFDLGHLDLDCFRKTGQVLGSCLVGYAGKPYIVLCTSGTVSVDVGGDIVDLVPGQAAFVPAREELFTLRGTGTTFLATVGAVPRP